MAKSQAKRLYQELKSEIERARRDQKKDGYIFYVDIFDSHRGFKGLAEAIVEMADGYGFDTDDIDWDDMDVVVDVQDEAMDYLTDLIRENKGGEDLYFGFNEGDGSIGILSDQDSEEW
jgi:hypothetical protein